MWIRPLIFCIGIEIVFIVAAFLLFNRSFGGRQLGALLASETGKPKAINWPLRVGSWLVLILMFCWSFVVGVFYSIWEFLNVVHS